MTLLSSALRTLAARFGYRIEKERYQRYGIDPIVDIKRLAAERGLPVRRCFDVGANIGQTAAALQAAFPHAEILCFEPVPTTYAQLQANIGTSSSIRIVNVALSDSVGEAVIHTYDSSLLSSLEPDALFTQGREGATTQTIRTDTLDRYCADHDIAAIDVLKIDTEGHDISVLRGAAGMLAASDVTFVLTEFNQLSTTDGEAIGSLQAIDDVLSGHGYSFIASYIDDIVFRDRPFVVGNALFIANRLARQ